MSGSIRRRGPKSWQLRIYVGMDARASRSLNVYAPAIPGGDRAATQQSCDRLKMAERGQVAMKVPLLPSGTMSTRSPQASPPEPVLYVHPTSFQYSGGVDPSAPGGIAAVYRDLVDDPIRTQQVVDDVMTALSSGRHCLVLTQWTRHLEQIAAGLTEGGHDPCRLPATWDQLAAGFASGMGPPPLPVMGPP